MGLPENSREWLAHFLSSCFTTPTTPHLGLPRLQKVSHPSNWNFHGQQNYQGPGPGELSFVSQGIEGEARKCSWSW